MKLGTDQDVTLRGVLIAAACLAAALAAALFAPLPSETLSPEEEHICKVQKAAGVAAEGCGQITRDLRRLRKWVLPAQP